MNPCKGAGIGDLPGRVVCTGGVVVTVPDERLRGNDLDAEFLAQFAGEGGLRGFAGFKLAAGEFPIAGEVGAREASAKQHVAIGSAQDADGDVERLGAHGAWLRCGTRR